MRLLLDAHTLIWAVDEPARLSPAAAAALQDPANELLVSAGTVWEIAIKVGLNKLKLTLPFRQWMGRAIADLGLSLLTNHGGGCGRAGRAPQPPPRSV